MLFLFRVHSYDERGRGYEHLFQGAEPEGFPLHAGSQRTIV